MAAVPVVPNLGVDVVPPWPKENGAAEDVVLDGEVTTEVLPKLNCEEVTLGAVPALAVWPNVNPAEAAVVVAVLCPNVKPEKMQVGNFYINVNK